MGLAVSDSNVSNTISSLTTVVNSTVSNTTQSVQETCNSSNTFTGIFGSVPISISPGNITLKDCSQYTNVNGLSINQTASNTCSLTGGLTTTLTQQINNNLQTNIEQWLKTEASANNGFLGFGTAIAIANGSNVAQLSQQIANSLTSNVSQVCNASLNSANTGTIYVCGSYPNGIVVTQSSVNVNLTSCMLQNMITNIENNSVLNDIVQKAAAKADAKNTGIDGIIKWIILAVVIVVVLVIIGVLLYFIFGNKSTPKPQGESKEQEKEMLEREIMEKKEGKTLNSKTSLNNTTAKKALFEQKESASSPSKFDSFKALAKKYGTQIGEYAGRIE